MDEFNFEYSVHEYVRARRAAYQSLGSLTSPRFWKATALTIGCVALPAGAVIAGDRFGVDFPLALAPLLQIAPLVAAMRIWRAPEREAPALLAEHGMACTIRVLGSGVAQSMGLQFIEAAWEDLLAVHETGEFFLFQVSGKVFLHLPKRALRQPQLVRLRALIVERLGSRAHLQPYDAWKS